MVPPALSRRRARRHLPLAAACALTLALVLLTGCGRASAGGALSLGPTAALPRSSASHVVVIVMENAEYGEVIGSIAAPYANSLARRYALATNSFAITHPSLPNYLALTSGSTQGITSDCTDCQAPGPSIVDQLEAAGISWGAYLEDMPSPCFRGAGAGGYAKKHNPFIYYKGVAGSARRCHRLVGFTQLAAALRSGTLPSYVWISPNLCDDGHDCGVAAGDHFLARTVPALLRELGPHGFLLLTWDEGVSNRGCCAVAHGGHIATILAGPDVRPGARGQAPVDHYGALATIEHALGLPPLAGAADPRSGSLESLFRHAPRALR
jgi:phosphatidylinositol-3-phosphatase